MSLYHISPMIIPVGSLLETGRRGYVCLVSSLEQALYWGWTLYGKDGRNAALANCVIHRVEVLGDGIVEDCEGHYAFEFPGVIRKAEDVRPHADLDGEVNSRNPVIVCEHIVLATADWQAWGEAHDKQVLAELGVR